MDSASVKFGIPSANLSIFEKVKYSTNLYFSGDKLFTPANPGGTEEIIFEIEEGEPVTSIARRLLELGLTPNVQLFQDLLVYSGLDTEIQTGAFKLDRGMSSVEIAVKVQDPSQRMIKFVILPGWRFEEIIAALPSSGLTFTAEELKKFVLNSHTIRILNETTSVSMLEGFLLPGEYLLDRNISADEFINEIIKRFSSQIDQNMIDSFHAKGFDLYDAVILASIIEREAILDEEKPLIASVFLNRLNDGWKLESDPTVQYALGYDTEKQTWWKSALTFSDLQIDSPYNTYMYPVLPPSPICNPNITSLRAVADPKNTSFYFFRAACDGSGRHSFAKNYEEHLANECP